MGDLIGKGGSRYQAFYAVIVVLSATVVASYAEAPHPPWQANPEWNTQQAEQEDLRLLKPGRPFDSELSSGKVRSLAISLKASQCLRVAVDHWGIDVDISWYGPSGEKIIQLGCRRGEPTPVTLIAEASGTYHLELRAPARYPANGRCQVTIEGLRVATAKDK